MKNKYCGNLALDLDLDLAQWSYEQYFVFSGLYFPQNNWQAAALFATQAQCSVRKTAKKNDAPMPLAHTALGRLSFPLN